MDFCFDTSAVNAAHDDSTYESAISRFKSTHRVLVSSVNIVEIVATSDKARRLTLLQFLKRISDGTCPLVMPNKLLKRVTKAHYYRKNVTLTIKDDDAAFWWLLEDPASATDAEQLESVQWKKSLEEPFKDAHKTARPAF